MYAGLSATSAFVPASASRRPAAAPMAASSRFSVRNCAITRARPGAQRRPHRDFLLPVGRARQQHVGDISARNQQYKPDRAQQHKQRRLDLADNILL